MLKCWNGFGVQKEVQCWWKLQREGVVVNLINNVMVAMWPIQHKQTLEKKKMNFDRMLDNAHLRPCAPILQSGVKPFPYSLTFTNLYELSFSDTKLTQTERKREREMGMMSLSSVMVLLMILLVQVSSTQYKVGDLDSWGIPTDAKVYSKWPKSHSFKIGDSLCK